METRRKQWERIMSYKWLYFMLLPGIIYYAVFRFGPMFGLVAAFKNYQPFLGFFGSEWVGMKHFIRFFNDRSVLRGCMEGTARSVLAEPE